MEAYDRLYEEKENIERIKQHTGDLLKIVQREIKRNEKKIPKLIESLLEAQDSLKWKEKAMIFDIDSIAEKVKELLK
jgi:hypothetical protein